jgi:hypothetical protein
MLSEHARVVLDTLLPSGAHPDMKYGVFDTGFDAFWSEFERTALPSLRRTIRAALFAAIWIAPLLIGRMPPLGLHDQPTRERALAAMACSRSYLLRQMLQLLKTTACFCYGADPGVRDAVGYPLQHDDPRHKAVG